MASFTFSKAVRRAEYEFLTDHFWPPGLMFAITWNKVVVFFFACPFCSHSCLHGTQVAQGLPSVCQISLPGASPGHSLSFQTAWTPPDLKVLTAIVCCFEEKLYIGF